MGGKWLLNLGQGFSQRTSQEGCGLLTGGPGSPLGLQTHDGQGFF